jgi:hypothetical protein
VLLAIAFAGGLGTSSSDTTAPVTTQPSALPPTVVSPPPDNPAAQPACTKLLTALPTRLAGLDQRRIVPATSPYVLAWGDPAVVLRCGVDRPATFVATSTVFNASSVGKARVYWLPVNQPTKNVFTTIDRSVYIEVTVPTAYPQPPLAPLSDAVASVLPAVCAVPEPGRPAPTASLCTHRR